MERRDLAQNMFEFERSEPRRFPGGTLHRVTKREFSALRGLAIQALHLNNGAVREPHVHPNAGQLDYCVSGQARVGIIGPEGHKQSLELRKGDISFVPQGYAHWIENVGAESLHFLVILSDEEPETIELSEMLSGVPKETLAKVLGVSEEILGSMPEQTVTIGGGGML
jgi:oxalate decarboxylase/phosphoglucose isomerase-like protein (cupin superfamily)